jgi:cobalamin biosynthesis Co2+ chelatase CbiK
MWFYVIASCVVVFSFSAIWWIFRRQERENVAKQLDKNAYNQKVNKMNTAKALLKTNEKLRQHYNTMITMYSNERIYGKAHRSKVIIKIMKETDDLDIATAVCALARIESNRRREKKYVQ